jgi:Spy/CpxP family protein refolding chaperone
MRTIGGMFVVLCAIALLTDESAGQDKKKGGRGGFGVAGLLQNASVQQELKLSDEQIEKAKKATEEVRTKFKDDLSKLRDATPEERATTMQKVSDATYSALADALKPDQIKRLKQIDIQARGPSHPEAQKALKLSDDQKEKIRKIGEDNREAMRDIFKGAKDNPKEAQEKMTKLRNETREKQLKVLTDEQQKQYKELTGAPFEIKREPRGAKKDA